MGSCDPLDLGQDTPALCRYVYLLLVCSVTLGNSLMFDTFYFPNCNMESVYMGLIINRTSGTSVKLPSRSPALRKFKTRISSSPWKEEISKSGVELQALERHACIHHSTGSQILPTSGMTQLCHIPLVDRDARSGQTCSLRKHKRLECLLDW